VVALFGDGPFRDTLTAAGISTTLLPASRLVRRGTRYSSAYGQTLTMLGAGVPAALQLTAIIRRARVDVVHTNGAKAHLLAGLASCLAGRPLVWHVRDFPPAGAAGRVFGHALRRFPDAVIANSGAIADSLRSHGGRAGGIVVVHNPVDLERFTPRRDRAQAQRALGLRAPAPTIGMVAHLTPWKGHDLFLRIASQILKSVPDAQFVIAGGSIYETEGHDGVGDGLRASIARQNLQHHVTLLGRRDDVPDVMAAMDVLVHCPTAPEPFGRVVAEAMAAGRPAVAARCGGLPEVVVDEETGFLVPPGDVDAFSRRVVQLLSDMALSARMGLAARRRAEQAFAVDAHADAVFDVYRRLSPRAGAAA